MGYPWNRADLLTAAGLNQAISGTWPWINAEASKYGAIGDGVADDTAALQRAADDVPATGGVLVISRPHKMSAALLLQSGTALWGFGSTLNASLTWPAPSSYDPAVTPGHCFVANRGFGASILTDRNITVAGLSFDWSALEAALGGTVQAAHSIRLRLVQRVLIRECNSNAGENGTAILACEDVTTHLCKAYGVHNAGFDHWEAPLNNWVTRCSAYLAAGQYNIGIQFTATNTLVAAGFNGANCGAIGNYIKGIGGAPNAAAGGLQANVIAAGCSLDSIEFAHNVIDANGAIKCGAIITGAATNVSFHRNTLKGTNSSSALIVVPDASGSPTNFYIDENKIVNPTTTDAGTACVAIFSGPGWLRGNTIVGGSRPNGDFAVIANGVRMLNNDTDNAGGFNASNFAVGNNNTLMGTGADGVINTGAPILSSTLIASYIMASTGSFALSGTFFASPTSGTTVFVPGVKEVVRIEGASTLAALTIQLPSASDGTVLFITFEPAVTSLSWLDSNGQSSNVVSGPSSVTAGALVFAIYQGSTSKWKLGR